ncbi:hypothetical protein AT251_19215 [Enterovibrio nigricans]|nr:hypothetical protein [Enterovibrio nigricans]PKF49400.1 hypothetical protein AT251_19215 [Enterovibrio nigricans]
MRAEVHALLRGSYDCWFMLMEWKANNKSESTRLESSYEDLLKDFVGHWEGWSYQICPDEIEPTSYDVNLLASTHHMEFTLMMLVSTLKYRNASALEWCVDMLNHWTSAFSLDSNSYIHYRWKKLVLNPTYLERDKSDNSWMLVLNDSDYCQESAIKVCFENFNLDLRLLAVAQLIKNPLDDMPYCRNLASKLLNGERIHSTGTIEHVTSIENASKVIEGFIRQKDYESNNNNSSYGSKLLGILERIKRDNAERMISGRTYMSSERNSLSGMSVYYVQICVSLSSNKWGLSTELMSVLLSGLFTYRDRESIISELRNWIELSSDLKKSFLYSDDDSHTLIQNFKSSLNEIIAEIVEYQTQSVKVAEIDDAILASYSRAASNVFCNELKYPLSLFKLEVVDSLPNEAEKLVSLIGVHKSGVSKGIVTNLPINDLDFKSDIVDRNASFQILNEIFNSEFIYEFSYTSALRALDDIRVMIDSINNPIMFVSSNELLTMFRKAKYDANIFPQLNIHFEAKDCSEYICHIGTCKVYYLNAKSEECLLLSSDAFDTIKVQKLAEDKFVDASFKVSDDNQTTGAIEFRYSMEIGLIQSEFTKAYEI